MDSHEFQRQLGQMEGRVESVTERLTSVEEVLERVRDRVPPWVALVLAGLSGLLGSAVTIIVAKG